LSTTLESELATAPIQRRHVMAVLAVVCAAVLANVLWAERTGVNGGLGWDGQMYGALVQRLPALLFGHEIDSYRIQRIFPSFLVRIGLQATGTPMSDPAVVLGYSWLNAFLVFGCAVLWTLVARELRFSVRGYFFGAISLFGSFAVLKNASYLPVLTDVTAFFLGFCALYAYLRRRCGWIVLIAVAGAFTWPVALPLCLPLILFPRQDQDRAPSSSNFATVVAVTIGVALTAILGYLYFVKGRRSAGLGPVVPIVEPLFPLSVALFAAMLIISLRTLLRGTDSRYVLDALRSVKSRAVVVSALLLVGSQIAIKALASSTAPALLPGRSFLSLLLISPVTRPLIAIVAHVIYLGPWVLLLVGLWPGVAETVRRFGPGFVAFFACSLILAMAPESRWSLFSVPAFVTVLVATTDRLRLGGVLYWVLAIAALVLSKAWLRIGPADGSDFAQLRLYFMNVGPYMDNGSYVVQGIAVSLLGLLMYFLIRRSRDSAYPASATS
jgi:hypothetical protein